MREKKYLPVNWKDGMKINKMHFMAQENAFTYQVAHHTGSFLNEYNYGLLPTLQNNGNAIKMFVSVDNAQQVQVRLQQCHAITKGGYYIEFEEDTALHGNNLGAPVLHLSVPFEELKGKTSTFYVIITVDPYQRVAHGLADPREQPVRIPYTMPAFHLSLIPEQETTRNLLGLFQLTVGKLKIEEQKLLLDENYIPPCTSISSHYELLQIHAELEQFYSKMEMYSLHIIQKILQKKQDNEMASIVQKICENITSFTAMHLAQLKTLCLYQPPVELVCMLSSFARMFKNTLDHYIGTGKEELINYFTEWCDVNQGELEGSINMLSNHKYNHLDLNYSLQLISQFKDIILNLFDNLAHLDYIGKRRDAGIFVKEKVLAREPETPFIKRRTFLAE